MSTWKRVPFGEFMTLKAKGQFVYHCLDSKLSCLYVGGATSIYNRFMNHRNDMRSQEWLALTAWIEYTECADRESRYQLEHSEYVRLSPPYNRQRPFATREERLTREYERRRSPAQVDGYRRRNREYARRHRAALKTRQEE